MKLDIRNLTSSNRRVRLVPREGATITLPQVATNPALLIEDSGALAFCLSPKQPVLGITCDGAIDRSGKFGFDGPVIFKIEPSGEEVQLANESELIAYIRAHPELGLKVKNYNRPTYELILPINDAPFNEDNYPNAAPELTLTLLSVGTNQNGDRYIESMSTNMWCHAIESPAFDLKTIIHDRLFPSMPANSPYLDKIKITTTRIDSPEVLNELIYKDELVAHLPMVNDLSGPFTMRHYQSAELDLNYNLAMYGINIDLSEIDPADVTKSLYDYFMEDSGVDAYKDRYHGTIDSFVIHAYEVYSLGDTATVVGADSIFDRQPSPKFPRAANSLMTAKLIQYPIGSDEVKFDENTVAAFEPFDDDNAYFLSHFGQIDRWKDLLDSTALSPDKSILGVGGAQQLPDVQETDPEKNIYAYEPSGYYSELKKINLPDIVVGDELYINSTTEGGYYAINGELTMISLASIRKDASVPAEYHVAYSPNALINQCLTIERIAVGNAYTDIVKYTPTAEVSNIPLDERVMYMLVPNGSLKFTTKIHSA